MITKKIRVAIDPKTWGRKTLPGWALKPPATQTVDLGKALLMLGSLTAPKGLSAGSPERYWACIRYFSACTEAPDLRIRAPFMDLDPHQKGILSDDFGVAVSTAWLESQLGGVRDIVDGRQFMINMGIRRSTTKPPKVGKRKCPDFVLEDRSGKFHVLECKGTQSGRAYLDGAMLTGQKQKAGIRVARAIRGESLVIGVSLAGEGDERESELVVIDPDEEPLTEIREKDAAKAQEILARLTIARALNLNGFSRAASEISWPRKLDRDSAEIELLTLMERKGLSIDRQDRQRGREAEFQSEFEAAPRPEIDGFVMQEMRFDLPSVLLDNGDVARRVTVRRGLSVDLVRGLANSGDGLRDMTERLSIDLAAAEQPVRFAETTSSARLDYGNLFYSEIKFD